jgi:hypothetical protein
MDLVTAPSISGPEFADRRYNFVLEPLPPFKFTFAAFGQLL